jgi:hypothetical protein
MFPAITKVINDAFPEAEAEIYSLGESEEEVDERFVERAFQEDEESSLVDDEADILDVNEFRQKVCCATCNKPGCACVHGFFVADDMQKLLDTQGPLQHLDAAKLAAAHPLPIMLPIYVPNSLVADGELNDDAIYGVLAFLNLHRPVTDADFTLLKKVLYMNPDGQPIDKLSTLPDDAECYCFSYSSTVIVPAILSESFLPVPKYSSGWILSELIKRNPFPTYWQNLSTIEVFRRFHSSDLHHQDVIHGTVGCTSGDCECSGVGSPACFCKEANVKMAPYLGGGCYLFQGKGCYETRRNIHVHNVEEFPILKTGNDYSDFYVQQATGVTIIPKDPGFVCGSTGVLVEYAGMQVFKEYQVICGPNETIVFFVALRGDENSLTFVGSEYTYRPEVHVIPSWGDWTLLMCRFSIPRVDDVTVYFGTTNIGVVNCGTEIEDFEGHYLRCVSMSSFYQNNFLTRYSQWGKRSWKTTIGKDANGHALFHEVRPTPVMVTPILNHKNELCSSLSRPTAYSRGALTGACNSVILNLKGGARVTVSTPFPSPSVAFFSTPTIHSFSYRKDHFNCFYCWRQCNGNCSSFKMVREFFGGLYRHGGVEPQIFLSMGDDCHFSHYGDDFILRHDLPPGELPALVQALGVDVVDEDQIQAHARENPDEESDDERDEAQYARNLYLDGEIDRDEYLAIRPDRGQDDSEDDDHDWRHYQH